MQSLFVRPDWFSRITPATLRADIIAALTGATIALPQGIAFAAIAGLPTEYGFYTAMVTPVVAALLGSSWHAVSGPATAISALVFASLVGKFAPGSPEFIGAAIVLALLVGVFQLALGLARLGALVDFVSHSVMTGFITGAALLIAMSQLHHAFGLDLPRPEHLANYASALWDGLPAADPDALIIAVAALATSVGIRQMASAAPNYLVALCAGTAVYFALGGPETDVATVGAIPSVVPTFGLPPVSVGMLRDLSSSALAIALVGLLEAMSISRAIAIRSGQQIDSNREFVGQGMSNVVGSFFQCYPGSASFTRSGVNYEAGAQTPLSAVFAALFLLVILLLVSPVFFYVPVAAMAGVIVHVAWRLVDFREIAHLLSTSRTEAWIAAVTFVCALFIDLEFAIYAGVLLSLALFLKKTSRPVVGIGAPDPSTDRRVFRFSGGLAECPQIMFAGIDGPFYFGSVEWVRRIFRGFERERPDQKHLVFIVKGVGEIDLPAAQLLIEEAAKRHGRGGSFHLLTKSMRTIDKLARFQVMKHLTKKHIHLSKGDAIAEIVPLADPQICATCKVRLFRECPPPPGAVSLDQQENVELQKT